MQEHEKDNQIMAELFPIFAQLQEAHNASSTGKPSRHLFAVLDVLTPKLNAALDFFEHHLTHEENRLSPVLRKNLNIPAMRETVQEVCIPKLFFF